MPILNRWSLFRLRPLLRDLHRIAEGLDRLTAVVERLVVVAEREHPSLAERRPKKGSVGTSVMTMRDRVAIAAAERTLRHRLGRPPTDEEVANLIEEAKPHLSQLGRE